MEITFKLRFFYTGNPFGFSVGTSEFIREMGTFFWIGFLFRQINLALPRNGVAV